MVTGGAGFIGSHLVDRIIAENPRKIVVADSLFLGKECNLDDARKVFPEVRFYHQDIAEVEATQKIIEDEQVDVVFNLAVIPLPTSLEKPRWASDINFLSASVICDLCRLGLFETLIHFSSSEVYGTAQTAPMTEEHSWMPCTPYAASKAAGDHLVMSYQKTFGIDASVLRPFNNFGPRQNDGDAAGIIPIVFHRARRGQPIVIFGDGEQTRDFLFVRDTAEAAVRIYETPSTRNRIVNVASGIEVSMNHLVRSMLDVMNIDVPIEYADPRPGDVRRHLGGVSLAKELIDFEATVSLEEGLKETISWYERTLV